MFPFDVILFDVGGVLLSNGWDHCEREIVLDRFHVDRAEFEARHPDPYRAWERGAIPVEAYLDATVFYQPDGAIGILKELAASDKYMLGALNNEARETNEYRFTHFGLRKYFRVALSSCYLGLRKPDPAIYRRVLDILGRPPERILLIDDREENTLAAAASGMKSIRFDGAESLRNGLEVFGVLSANQQVN